MKMNKLLTIGICGRSCSGKGVVTEAIASTNQSVLLLQADYYFHKNNSCSYNGYPCIEHINSIDFDRLINDVICLQDGKDTVIRVTTPWMSQVNIEITARDLRVKKLLVIEGHLVFAVSNLANLFDHKLFIQSSDYEILYRRLLRDGFNQLNYIHDVVIPVSKEYRQIQTCCADKIVDGDRLKNEVLHEVKQYFREKLPSLSFDQPPYKVQLGDLISDDAWHPIDFCDYKDWVKKRSPELDKGEVLKGNTFEYRKNLHSNRYEIRLGTWCKPRIWRYTLKETAAH
jgi:uridine kinase